MDRIQAGITSMGMAAPPDVLTNFELEEIVDTSDEWIRSRSGIRTRHIAKPDKATSDYAVMAAQQALVKRGITPDEIDVIIVATVTPDYLTPSTASIVQHKLGALHAAAFDVSAGCTGWVYSLTLAQALVVSGAYQKVLVIGADLLSRITNYYDRTTCVLLGDGAGAAVVEPVPEGFGFLASYIRSDGAGAELLFIPSGGSKHPLIEEDVKVNQNKLVMNGNEVYKFAVKVMEEAVLTVLERAGLNVADVDLIVPHQANIRIIEAAAKRLNIPMERIIVNLAEYGNTSNASIPMALSEGVEPGRIKKGQIIVKPAFGAGLTWGAVVSRWAY